MLVYKTVNKLYIENSSKNGYITIYIVYIL